MYLIILSYFNSFKNVHDIEVFGMYQTIKATDTALEKYEKIFNFRSFLLDKNIISNEGSDEIYETYQPNTNMSQEISGSLISDIEGYQYKFLIKNYKHIGEKQYSFIPHKED
jgi:hypothetical protein